MYKTIIVVDTDEQRFELDNVQVMTFATYLADYPKRGEPKTRLINLCDTEHYLSRGYYCSLLAEARKHRVLPSVSTINDLRTFTDQSGLSHLQLGALAASLPLSLAQPFQALICFGRSQNPVLAKLARQVFDKFPVPILLLTLEQGEDGVTLKLQRLAYSSLNAPQKAEFNQQLQRFTEQVWRTPNTRKAPRWDMAILVNPEEPSPPSDKDALKRFVKAAEKVGIHAELIQAKEAAQISQYDALFIRETTAIDHHTYRLARKAEQEGLVVIDDSTSILRCCNKVFLHDAFSYHGVPSPKTEVVITADAPALDQIEQQFSYPMVLKMPEGSFSRGVFKVKDRAELKQRLDELFIESALVLVQEYLFTEYDWRIGVLGGKPIYACRYHMARNHWQIYNHASKRFNSGGFETLPTFEVPKKVLDAAIKASNMIGQGLYGVDIKFKDNQVYVIEVNDNPSLDHKVEDLYLGDELYMLIMQAFVDRLEQRGRR